MSPAVIYCDSPEKLFVRKYYYDRVNYLPTYRQFDKPSNVNAKIKRGILFVSSSMGKIERFYFVWR